MSSVSGNESARPPNPRVTLTYDDFVQLQDDGKRHELIDGEHYVTASPNLKHQAIAGNLHGLLWTDLGRHRRSTSAIGSAVRIAGLARRVV